MCASGTSPCTHTHLRVPLCHRVMRLARWLAASSGYRWKRAPRANEWASDCRAARSLNYSDCRLMSRYTAAPLVSADPRFSPSHWWDLPAPPQSTKTSVEDCNMSILHQHPPPPQVYFRCFRHLFLAVLVILCWLGHAKYLNGWLACLNINS